MGTRNTINNTYAKFPCDFQEKFIQKIANGIKSGESLQITGAPGAGSSLILNLLAQVQEIREKHFGKNHNYILIPFDADSLVEQTSLGATRLLLAKLNPTIESSNDSLVVEKLMAEVVKIVQHKKLVIMIDHFDKLNSNDYKQFLSVLYTSFRNNETNISFIFATQQPITSADKLTSFGLLARCITQNVFTIPQLNKRNSIWFTQERAANLKLTLNEKQTEKIYMLSGGFPRTIRRIVEAISNNNELEQLEADPSHNFTLFLHLKELASYKNLLNDIPILDTFLRNKSALASSESIGGLILKSKLTKSEERLLNILLVNKNKIANREATIEKLWNSNSLDVSDHAYDQIVHRLRGKLNGSVPQTRLETIKGRGHKLVVETI